MGSRNECAMIILFLLSFGEPIETTGLCKFARMFPGKGASCHGGNLSEGKVNTQESTSTPCPPNMIVANGTCAATCEEPTRQHGCCKNCTGAENCVCPKGFLKKEKQCVLHNKCACFLSEAGKVLSKHDFFVAPDCSMRCDCREKELVCDNDYRCSPNASCEERHNVRQCYCNDGFVGNGKNCTLATDCYDIFNTGINNSGIYTIQPSNWIGSAFEVYCNMENDGGWTVFQRRVNGSVDFYNDWEDYKGFGILDHEFWLGNDKIYSLTNQADYVLRIDLVDSLGAPYYATYDMFRIATEDDSYRLTDLGAFNGTTDHDALANNKGYAFSTYDRDNDDGANFNCAMSRHGAWWYKFCANANLNGDYSTTTKPSSVYWLNLPGGTEANTFTEMKIRPIRN